MEQWGWLLLVLCIAISLWSIGCTDAQEPTPTPTPTNLPEVTLIVRTPQLNLLPTEPGLPIRVTLVPTLVGASTPERRTTPPYPHLLTIIDPKTASLLATATPNPIILHQPTCYPTPDEGIVCLGYLENPLNTPLENTVVSVTMFLADGTKYAEQIMAVEQRRIPMDGIAPYRVVYPAVPNQSIVDLFGGVIAQVQRAEPASTTANPAPQILREVGRIENGRYRLTFDLYNPAAEMMQALQVVATLFDEGGRVVGYRISEIDQLEAAETTSVELTMIPQYVATGHYHRLHISTR